MAKKKTAAAAKSAPKLAATHMVQMPAPAVPQKKPYFLSIDGIRASCTRMLSSKWVSSPWRLFILATLVWIAFMLGAAMLLPPTTWSLSFSEAPLAKNSPLMIAPGDEFTYSFLSQGAKSTMDIAAADSAGCPGILLYDKKYAFQKEIAQSSVCVGNDGVQLARNGTRIGSNTSYDGIIWPYFSPWMLALGDGWSWKVNSSFSTGAFGQLSTEELLWKVSGNDTLLGREGYQVSLFMPDGQGKLIEVSRTLVDKEKRVLLRYEGPEGVIELVNATFIAK